MPLSTTNKAAYQQYKSSLLLPLRRKKNYDKATRIISLIVMCAPHTDKIILSFCEYKNHSKENTSTIMSMWHLILNHSQGNFVMEIKQISWSCPDSIFFKNKYPNPILIQKIASILQDIQSWSCPCSPLLEARFQSTGRTGSTLWKHALTESTHLSAWGATSIQWNM